MSQIKTEPILEIIEGIDFETLEKYIAKVTENSIELLEAHTKLIRQMHQSGLADYNSTIHLEHINKCLCKKLLTAQTTNPKSLVSLAVELALKERGLTKRTSERRQRG